MPSHCTAGLTAVARVLGSRHPRGRVTGLLGVVATMLVALVAVIPWESHAADGAESEALPLAVSITTLNPSTLELRDSDDTDQMITIRGRVTNNDEVTWWNLHVYAFMGSYPMTTSTELSYYASSSVDLDDGPRLSIIGDFDIVGSLEPGESTTYSIKLPVAHLPVDVTSASGVYRFGVHVLGENWAGRVDGADGKARTFLPVMTAADPAPNPVQVALTSAVRHAVNYSSTGSLTDAPQWRESLSTGRLRKVLKRAAAAEDYPVTWLVDPAVIDAVGHLAAGNPERSITETSSSTGDAQERDTGPAARWLRGIVDLPGTVVSLPYGDLDLAAAADGDPDLIDLARDRAQSVMAERGIESEPGVAPPTGVLDTNALASVADSVVILSDAGLVTREDDGTETTISPSSAGTVDDRVVFASSSAVASGGPGPTPAGGSMAVRQRLLAEVAVRALSDSQEPLVAALPEAANREFFAGLDTPWLEPVGITDLDVDPVPAELSTAGIAPDLRTVVDARGLIAAGRALQDLLTDTTDIANELSDEALTATSYARSRETDPSASTRASTSAVRTLMSGVRMEAPQSVTLASNSGRFSVTVANDLDQSISVALVPKNTTDIRFDLPDVIDIPAKSAATVLLTAHAERSGRHNVEMILTGATGVPVGPRVTIPIRAAEVSRIIWLVIGTGLALLAGAIVLRLVRRVRGARSSTPTSEGE